MTDIYQIGKKSLLFVHDHATLLEKVGKYLCILYLLSTK